MIEIKPAGDCGEGTRRRISEVFVDGYGQHLAFFSKDHHKLAQALEHMFVLDVFYVALVDGAIAGIAACTDGKIKSITSDSRELIKHLGFFKGILASIVFKQVLEKPHIITGDRIAWVELVATAAKYRGQGVASAIMSYLFTLPQYDEYVLEVADTNANAVRLYQKIGFREFKRVKHKHSRLSGVNYLIYMKYQKQQNQ